MPGCSLCQRCQHAGTWRQLPVNTQTSPWKSAWKKTLRKDLPNPHITRNYLYKPNTDGFYFWNNLWLEILRFDSISIQNPSKIEARVDWAQPSEACNCSWSIITLPPSLPRAFVFLDSVSTIYTWPQVPQSIPEGGRFWPERAKQAPVSLLGTPPGVPYCRNSGGLLGPPCYLWCGGGSESLWKVLEVMLGSQVIPCFCMLSKNNKKTHSKCQFKVLLQTLAICFWQSNLLVWILKSTSPAAHLKFKPGSVFFQPQEDIFELLNRILLGNIWVPVLARIYYTSTWFYQAVLQTLKFTEIRP